MTACNFLRLPARKTACPPAGRHDRPAALLLALLLLPALFLGAGCKYGAYYLQFTQDSPDQRASSLTLLTGSDLPALGSESCYSFVIIADPHFGAAHSRHDSGFIDWFTRQLAASDSSQIPRFVVNVGDTLNAGADSEADDYQELCEQIRQAAATVLGDSDFKIYTILGNHDLYNDGWSVWKKRIYPYTSYYAFQVTAGSSSGTGSSTGGFSFYFLDSGNGTLGESQLNDFIANLEADSRPKIVFSHYAVYAGGIFYYTLQDTMERNLLISAFAKNNVKYVFEGHDHYDHTYSWKSFDERAVPSFLYRYQCSLVTVNEEGGEVESQLIDF